MNLRDRNLILVPYDFSDEAESAVDHAVFIARMLGYKLLLLHVLAKRMQKEDEKKAAEAMSGFGRKLASEYGLVVNSIIRYGKIFSTISDVAREETAAFVIMGVSGKRGTQHLMGSSSYKVVCCSRVPVIVVKEKHRYDKFRNIVVPIDFSRRSVQKIAQAIKFAKFFNAKVRVFGFISHANKARIIHKEALLKSVNDVFVENGVEVTSDLMVNPGLDWPEALMMFSEQVEGDLIMIVAEQGGKIQDIFSSNYTERILDEAEVPVFTIMPDQEDLENETASSHSGFVTPFVDPFGFFKTSEQQ